MTLKVTQGHRKWCYSIGHYITSYLHVVFCSNHVCVLHISHFYFFNILDNPWPWEILQLKYDSQNCSLRTTFKNIFYLICAVFSEVSVLKNVSNSWSCLHGHSRSLLMAQFYRHEWLHFQDIITFYENKKVTWPRPDSLGGLLFTSYLLLACQIWRL